MKKVTETTFEYDPNTADVVKQTTTEYIEYDEKDPKVLFAEGVSLDGDDDDGETLCEGEISISLSDLIAKALALFTFGVSAVTAVKLLQKVSK